MPQADPHVRQSFPVTQRELVGLALQRGGRRRDADAAASTPAPHRTQRELVRLAVALGLGGRPKAARPARTGIYR